MTSWVPISHFVVVVNPAGAGDLVASLVDPTGGAQISNIVFTRAPQCAGIFLAGQLAVPQATFPDTGIVLSTGDPASLAFQDLDDTSLSYGLGGDPSLDALVGAITRDACVLEFDVQCPAGRDGPANVAFEYVWGSEEYNEFTGSQFNDVFGFFLNGNNIALLPDGVTPVSINTVNAGLNAVFFNNNDPSDTAVPFPNFEADGFTSTLTASGPVNNGIANSFKLAIADVGDRILDSWVLVKGSSFKCTNTRDDDKPNGVSGDPHFKTWSGHKFDYHGACDLVLLQNPDFNDKQGMDIHIRTKHIRELSYVSSAVVRIGEDLLEVHSDKYFVNAKENAELPTTVGGFKVTHKVVNDHQQTFMIHVKKQKIVIKTWKQFVSVKIEHATADDFGRATGLMGSFGEGHMFARDGITVLEHDVDAFGQEWQVMPWEAQLFQETDGPQYPEQCTVLKKTVHRRRLGEVSEEQAAQACAEVPPEDRDFCVYDVMATNDLSMAGAY